MADRFISIVEYIFIEIIWDSEVCQRIMGVVLVAWRKRRGHDMFRTMVASARPYDRHSMHLELVALVAFMIILILIRDGAKKRGRLLPRRDSRFVTRRCRAIAASAAGCGSDKSGSRAKDCVELGVDGKFDVDRVGGCFSVDERDEDT